MESSRLAAACPIAVEGEQGISDSDRGGWNFRIVRSTQDSLP